MITHNAYLTCTRHIVTVKTPSSEADFIRTNDFLESLTFRDAMMKLKRRKDYFFE